jgi:hypothetical protein
MRLDDLIEAAREFSACAKGVSDGSSSKPEHCQRAAPKGASISEGRLLMADFKESSRILRVHPPVGPAITCKFPENLIGEVQDCIRRFVRVRGRMQYHPTGEAQSLEITDIEPLEKTASGSAEWSYAFWENLSAEQYAERHGGRPIEQVESLYGAGQTDDWEGFDEALEDWRTPQPT